MSDPDRPAEEFGFSPRPSGHRAGQWVAVASLVIAVLTLLIALPGAINDWTTLRTPQPTPTDTTSATTSAKPTTPSTRPTTAAPTTPAPTKTAKPDQGKGTPVAGAKDILERIDKFRANLGVRGLISVIAAGAVVIFICAGICRSVIILSYWPIGIPTFAILIAIPFFVWPTVSGYDTITLAILGVGYAVTGIFIAWLGKVIADP